MSEKPRERQQFTLSRKDINQFIAVKEKLERKLGLALTNADVIRHSLAAQIKQLEA